MLPCRIVTPELHFCCQCRRGAHEKEQKFVQDLSIKPAGVRPHASCRLRLEDNIIKMTFRWTSPLFSIN